MIIGKRRVEEEDRHKGSLTQKRSTLLFSDSRSGLKCNDEVQAFTTSVKCMLQSICPAACAMGKRGVALQRGVVWGVDI
jgi:hypothetical protein